VAAVTQVTAVRVQATQGGATVVLTTKQGDRPRVFTTERGRAWVADIINTQLVLGGSNSFQQENPAPGIAMITVTPLDANSVRVTVTGTEAPPTGEVVTDGPGLVFKMGNGERGTGNGEIAINGVPIPAQPTPLEPTLPRPTAPPVGDIAVSSFNAAPDSIDLGTDERVPRLVLRDVQAREVLALLARSTGMNLVYLAPDGGGEEGPRVTLDIIDESVQDVFNYVLRITDLQASRAGRTIFIGPQLPDFARNIIVRTLRLNQVDADAAATFLATQGAAVQQIFVPVREVRSPETGAIIERITEPAQLTSLTVPQLAGAVAPPLLLQGLAVTTDERLNTITLIGEPGPVQLAMSLIPQLDARRRQVAVNVKVIDVNLGESSGESNASFSFGVGDTFVSVDGGRTTVTHGSVAPPSVAAAGAASENPPSRTPSAAASSFPKEFLSRLRAEIEEDTAKILTDPTIVIQEGQRATVKLVEDAVVNVTSETGEDRITTTTVEIGEVGLVLNLNVQRIDDNGFVSLAVEPVITAPSTTADVQSGDDENEIRLLSERSVTTGQIRMRDGQTLILAGIIQEVDREDVSKTPFLGDLPVLGTLFRNTSRASERTEIIVLVTPQILDDSEGAGYGFNYQPGPEIQNILEQRRRR